MKWNWFFAFFSFTLCSSLLCVLPFSLEQKIFYGELFASSFLIVLTLFPESDPTIQSKFISQHVEKVVISLLFGIYFVIVEFLWVVFPNVLNISIK